MQTKVLKISDVKLDLIKLVTGVQLITLDPTMRLRGTKLASNVV